MKKKTCKNKNTLTLADPLKELSKKIVKEYQKTTGSLKLATQASIIGGY